MSVPINLAIVGVGLIGGSVGLAARSSSKPFRVVGFDLDPHEVDSALARGAIDDKATTLEAAVEQVDVVVICAPVTVSSRLIIASIEANPNLRLITDVGSTKAKLIERVGHHQTASRSFVGAHPLAGSERRGVDHSNADLIRGRTCVLTPTDTTSKESLALARDFWLGLGCRLIELDPASHDEAMALTSHLPHAVASALCGVVEPRLRGLAAGAFRDGTRVSAADANLWSGIFLENRENLLASIEKFEGRLTLLHRALKASDRGAIIDWWQSAYPSSGGGS